jgi:tetratricopeptide repeat protein
VAQPSPLSPAWQRAQALADSGDLAGARAVLERAVELGRVNLSEDDPDVLRTSYLLAGIHQRADEPSAARRVLEEAYAAGQWRLGDADPLMVEISHDIGVVAEELGNRHEARKAFGRVAEFGPSVLGAQHRAVARARAYLGQGPGLPVRPEAAPQAQAPPMTQAVPQAQAAPPVQDTPQAQVPPSFHAAPQAQVPPSFHAAPQKQVPPSFHAAPQKQVPPSFHAAPQKQVAPPVQAAPQTHAAPQTQDAPQTHAAPQTQGAPHTPAASPVQATPQTHAAPPAEPTSPIGLAPGTQVTPSTPYGTPRQNWHGDRPPHPSATGSPVPDQRTAQMGGTPAAFEPEATYPAERPANVFGADPRPSGPGLVQPPSPANQQVWTGPAVNPPNPINEATVAHPVILPRAGAGAPAPGVGGTSETRVSDQRQASGPSNYFGPSADAARSADPAPYGQESAQRPYEKRGMGLFAAIAAVLAAVIAVVALVFVLANRGDDQRGDPNVPTLGGEEPTAVRLRDEGSKIAVTWQDPSAGTVSFMVAMGHPGEQLKPVATLGPGQTSYEMGALNTALNYCFTVIAVYRSNQFATSAQTCTDRPAPSTSK